MNNGLDFSVSKLADELAKIFKSNKRQKKIAVAPSIYAKEKRKIMIDYRGDC